MHIKTPLIHSRYFSARSHADVWLKLEALQPVGSFKIRGIGYACAHHAEHGARGFVSSSGGNAGLAVAYAGRELGLPVTVIVPASTTPRAIELIRREGAEVRIHGENWNQAHEVALSMASEEMPLIHPYDDPLLWQGHASIIDEIAEQIPGDAPDAVLLSVGGGGLLCGVMQGLVRNHWAGVPVIAVETQGAASFAAACAAGEPVTIDNIRTIATSLGARRIADQAFAFSQKYDIRPLTVSDDEALQACGTLLDEHRILVEPACGAALAPLLSQRPDLAGLRHIVVIVCGGVGVSLEQLQKWQVQLSQT